VRGFGLCRRQPPPINAWIMLMALLAFTLRWPWSWLAAFSNPWAYRLAEPELDFLRSTSLA
jgi:hypothetical protein